MFETIVRNHSGEDIVLQPSGVYKYPFNIRKDGVQVIPSRSEYGILARYSEIIFQKGKAVYKETEGSNVVTKSVLPGAIKCIVRKGWVEPKRAFPVVSFLNEGGTFMEIYYPDCFNINEKLYLPLGIPIMASVPVYMPLAKFKEFVIHEEIMELGESIPDHEMKGKRSEQELQRLAKMLNDWKEAEKNRIKVM